MNRKFPKNKEEDEGREREEKSEGANTGQILRSTKAFRHTALQPGQYMAASHTGIPSL